MRGEGSKEQGKSAALRAAFFLFPLVFGLAPAGCRNCDLVEAELRSRDNDLHQMRDELHKLEAYNLALQRELRDVRTAGPARVSPEQASQTYTLKAIALGRQTGGYDADGIPGDEALMIALEPQDPDGHAIKAPGTLTVQAMEVSPEGVKRPLCSWSVAPEQLRGKWRSGLLSTGYNLVLPWKNWPTMERVRVVAQLTLADGRLFEAEKDVTVRLAPSAYRKPALAEPAAIPDVLPPPRKFEPVTPEETQSRKPATLGAAQPAADWQQAEPSPLSRAVQLMRPVPMHAGQ